MEDTSREYCLQNHVGDNHVAALQVSLMGILKGHRSSFGSGVQAFQYTEKFIYKYYLFLMG